MGLIHGVKLGRHLGCERKGKLDTCVHAPEAKNSCCPVPAIYMYVPVHGHGSSAISSQYRQEELVSCTWEYIG